VNSGPVILNLPLKAITSPKYANVAVTLISVSPPNQQMQLMFQFKNDGTNVCKNINFHTITLTDSNGTSYKRMYQTHQEWTLLPGQTIIQSPQFQENAQQGVRYTLRFVLTVGGCIQPQDTSKNEIASYPSVSFTL